MSWIVQSLLRNKESIKEKKELDSDEYNDLLIIESKVESLYKSGIITESEKEVLDLVSSGETFTSIERKLNIDRGAFSDRFSSICNKIAFYAGSYFTDDGYLFYMKRKYKLSDEEVLKLRTYMQGKHRNKLIRKKL